MSEIVKDENAMREIQSWNNAVLVKQGDDFYVVSTAPAVPGLEDIFPENTIVVQAQDESGVVDLDTAEPVYSSDDGNRQAALDWLDEQRPVAAAV
jgi:outer membrane protease